MNAPPLFFCFSILLFACPLKSIMPFMQARHLKKKKKEKKMLLRALMMMLLVCIYSGWLDDDGNAFFRVVSCAPRCLSMPPTCVSFRYLRCNINAASNHFSAKFHFFFLLPTDCLIYVTFYVLFICVFLVTGREYRKIVLLKFMDFITSYGFRSDFFSYC